LCSYKGELI